jgi:hypothetical protein
MVTYAIVQNNEELEGIRQLLEDNLGKNLSAEERIKEGFLTVAYSLEDLKRMHETEPGIIAKDNDKVVAYVLAMIPGLRKDFPILEPLFQLFEKINYNGKPVSTYNYLIVGQACIDKPYRGKGVFKKLYTAYSLRFRDKYDFAISEIATKNLRSMNAHKRIGFLPVYAYTGPDGVDWTVVIQDWTRWPE